MSDKNADEGDDSERDESGDEARSRGFHLEAGLRPLSELLGNLIEVNVSESPPPPSDPVAWETVDEGRVDRESRGENRRKRTKRVRKTRSDACLIDTHFEDEEFVVTADVPGSSKDDLSVGIDPRTNTLVISKDGTVLERVDLPWESPETTNVWFNNGVLEVRMRPNES